MCVNYFNRKWTRTYNDWYTCTWIIETKLLWLNVTLAYKRFIYKTSHLITLEVKLIGIINWNRWYVKTYSSFTMSILFACALFTLSYLHHEETLCVGSDLGLGRYNQYRYSIDIEINRYVSIRSSCRTDTDDGDSCKTQRIFRTQNNCFQTCFSFNLTKT